MFIEYYMSTCMCACRRISWPSWFGSHVFRSKSLDTKVYRSTSHPAGFPHCNTYGCRLECDCWCLGTRSGLPRSHSLTAVKLVEWKFGIRCFRKGKCSHHSPTMCPSKSGRIDCEGTKVINHFIHIPIQKIHVYGLFNKIFCVQRETNFFNTHPSFIDNYGVTNMYKSSQVSKTYFYDVFLKAVSEKNVISYTSSSVTTFWYHDVPYS